jgi:purine-nucleoside phosphorylase
MNTAHPSIADIREAAYFLTSKIGFRPAIGIISGTGLECLRSLMSDAHTFPVATIPNFPSFGTTDRAILSGLMGEIPGLLLNRRLHVYEGYSMAQIAFVVRLFRELGVKIMIVTNAAGGLNPDYEAGQMMLITDHINMMGGSPLTGPNPDEYGPRFPDMSAPYDSTLIQWMEETARKLKIQLWKGVYVAVPGPNLETRAETRFLRSMGADAVGMSTVPEVIAAVHCGMRVLGISILSNINLPDSPKVHTLEEIVEVVNRTSPVLQGLLNGFLNGLSQEMIADS